jgi:hypothetical protein
MQPNFLLLGGVDVVSKYNLQHIQMNATQPFCYHGCDVEFSSMILTTSKCMQSKLFVTMGGVECMVNIYIVIEGHSKGIHVCL